VSGAGLRFGWQQAVHIVAAGSSKSTVKGDMASGQNSYSRLAAVRSRSLSAVVSGGHGYTGQLRANANHSELCHSAGRPALASFRREPLDRGVVMLMLRNKQRDQHVDVQKADHGGDYSPAPSARRSTSSTDSVGAPGRRGNTGTPRSNRTSASAIRLSSASTNSSTRCPDWLARSASRSFNAASTVIVAFGMQSLSHDVVRREPRDVAARRAASQHVAAWVGPNLGP
jgi:hypothetical protein